MGKIDIDDLGRASAGTLAKALAAKRLSAAEACEAAIARIERLDGAINAVVVRDFERARQAAAAADAALARGERAALLGVPMTVKEAHNVAGLPTTWGIEEARDFVPSEDSVAVARLKKAGAVILGKTNVPPHLGDWQSVNPIYGRTNHPLDLARTPGGSSGGSAAALAAGMVPLEFGSDIGGSIRVPAAFCGVFGHKPTHGAIPQRGHTPPGVDGVDVPLGVIGPMARTAADLDLALGLLAGPDDDYAAGYSLALPAPRHERLGDFKVLVIGEHPVAKVQGEITAAVDALAGRLEQSGARVERSSNLVPDLESAQGVYMTILGAIISRGAAGAEPISAHDWMRALDAQLAIRRKWAQLFEAFDLVLAPAFGVVAFPHDDAPFAQRKHVIDGVETVYGNQVAWPGMASLANLPATSAPIGKTRAGLPIGVQIIGPHLADRTTIAFAGLIEREFG